MQAPKRLTLICALFGFMFLGLLITSLSQLTFGGVPTRDSYLLIASIQDLFCFIVPAVGVAMMVGRKNIKHTLSLNNPGWRPLVGATLLYLLSIPALNYVTYVNEHIHLPQSMQGVEQWFKTMEDAASVVTETILSDTSIMGLVSGVLVVGAMAAVSEELFFRSSLQRILSGDFSNLNASKSNKESAWNAIILVGFIFSVMHFQMFGFFPRFLLGVMFGWLLFTTKSVYPGIIAHFLNNSMVVVAVWCIKRGYVSQQITELGTPDCYLWLAPLSIFCVIVFLSFLRTYFFKQIKN